MCETKSVVRYDYNYLQQYCKENSIELLKDYSTEKVNRNTIIEAICLKSGCQEKCVKGFRVIVMYGCYCKKHTQENKLEKIKQTTLYIYGVCHNSQLQEIKDKKTNTTLNNWGVENPFQSKAIKEKMKKKSLQKWGVEYPMQNIEVQNKVKETNKLVLGVEYPTQNKEVREKCKKTTLINYGVENISQNERVKKIKEETCLKNHGVKYPSQSEEIRKKQQDTMMTNIGCKHALQSEEIRNKIKSECLVKYGKEHFMQVPEIAEKSFNNSFKLKERILPSGKIVKYQGYENYVWEELLQTLNETDIISGCVNVPEISYLDANNKSHTHYVDFFIPRQNKCIECKSTFTLGIKKDNIFLKQQSGKVLGYEYEIWVYNSKGEKVECYK